MKYNSRTNVGKAVRDFRLLHGFSQEEMAEFLGLKTGASVSDLETGRVTLKRFKKSLDKRNKILHALASYTPVERKKTTKPATVAFAVAKETIDEISKALHKQALLIIKSLIDKQLAEQ